MRPSVYFSSLLGIALLFAGGCDGEAPTLTARFDLRGAPIDPGGSHSAHHGDDHSDEHGDDHEGEHADDHEDEHGDEHGDEGEDQAAEAGSDVDPALEASLVDAAVPVELGDPGNPGEPAADRDGADQPEPSAPAPGPEAVEETPDVSTPEADEPASDELLRISFDELAFADYDPPELRDDDEDVLPFEAFPEDVQDLHGSRISIDGFMVALEVTDRSVDTFMLHRFPPGCCFGSMPLMDEWIEVNVVDGEGEEFSPYQMITVEGRFAVGEEVDEDGFVLSIYRLSGRASEAL